MLANSKLNSVETLIYQALTDLGVSHEEFKTIVNKKKYKKKWKKAVMISSDKLIKKKAKKV